MPPDCSLEAAEISAIRSPTFAELWATLVNASLVAVTSWDPSLTFFTVPSMSWAVFLAASAARMARFLTSSATTANPAPASPARAASTAAFNASRLVWNAISSMVLMILEVSSLALEMSFMDTVSRSMESLAVATTWLASFISPSAVPAFSALFLVMEAISSMDEEVSSMDAACSEAPSAMDWLADDTWPEADATWSAPSLMSWAIRVMVRLIPREIRSPSPMASAAPRVTAITDTSLIKADCLREAATSSPAT